MELNTGIQISDMDPRDYLAFDLRDILSALGRDIQDCWWRCTGTEITTNGVELPAFLEAGNEISSSTLIDAANDWHQTIWGYFSARRSSEREPWLEIRAVDSSFWEVLSDSESALKKCCSKFRTVKSFSRSADDHRGTS